MLYVNSLTFKTRQLMRKSNLLKLETKLNASNQETQKRRKERLYKHVVNKLTKISQGSFQRRAPPMPEPPASSKHPSNEPVW